MKHWIDEIADDLEEERALAEEAVAREKYGIECTRCCMGRPGQCACGI